MHEFSKLTLPGVFSESVEMYREHPVLSFVGEKPITYGEMGNKVKALIAFMEKHNIKQGDKVVVLSSNMPNWGIAYFAIASMGAVVVPILPDFSEEEIKNVVEHSETKAAFVSESLIKKFPDKDINFLVKMDDFSLIKGIESHLFEENAVPQNKYKVEEDDLASIIYTSGTTGKSKGVMLTHKNISFTASSSRKIQEIIPGDRFLSVLPLSHTYENTIGFVLPIICGACVYYITKPPTPAVLLPALKEVRPTLMLTVPLIIEKIYRGKVLPAFNDKWITKSLYKVPVLRKKFNQLAGKKLMRTFGGELKFFGIGGAKLNKTVEKFLIEANFPYAVGYGLTETAPLLAGMAPFKTKLQSTGPKLEGVTLKIHNPQKYTGEGEIWAKGPNIMKGYYKEPQLTKEVLTEDGWFKTGDLGIIDKDNYLFIRGRSKNVIVGPSGENIFPEDIESVINNFKHVAESLVISQKGKLVALVHFNREEIEQQYQHMKEEVSNYVEKKYDELEKELKDFVNSKVNRFSKIQTVVVQKDEFVKTATKKIKRFLYSK
ncbi:MAG: AMP-dependent synthetase [Marinilabiliales bacterium]|nr:MAG: AMP-dependent synthetase [Marinilabiliales bacterium]